MKLTERDERRFRSKVALPNREGCMLWLKYVRPDGYAEFSLAGQSILAHRVSYVLAYGAIPEGLQVDHVKARGCTNRHCVAPEHLEAVTPGENVRRGDSGKHWRTKTRCKHGHSYSAENTRIYRGGRECRTCRKASKDAYDQRQKAA